MKLHLVKPVLFILTGIQLVLLITFFPACRMREDSQKVSFKFKDQIEGWLDENHVPAIGIGIIENGKIKHVNVFGETKAGVKAPKNTLFNIASVTKPVVSILTLKLVASGDWQLDEPLSKYWTDPDVASDPRRHQLTTRHVLTHQSGFSNWRWNNPGQKLVFENVPGSHYQYSGEGFEYLKRALEHKFKKPITMLLDSVLFKPLKMKNTRYWSTDLDTARFAYWHDKHGTPYPGSIKTNVSASDDLITTVEDMCRFGVFVLNGAGLPQDLFNDMVRPQVSVNEGYGRGLGWGVVPNLPNQEYAIEHAGSDKGVRTRVIFLPKSKRGIIVFTNGDNGEIVYDKVIQRSMDVGEEVMERIK